MARQQVNERGLKAVAELLGYNAANLAKVVAGNASFRGSFGNGLRDMDRRDDRSLE